MRSVFKSITAVICCAVFFMGCTKEYITNIVSGPAPAVEAGNSQTIQLPVNSVGVTGTVTKSSSKIVGYLWSQVSGPNVPEIATESSATTEIKGMTEGRYVFQFLAIDSAGLTGVDTLSVTVKSAPIQTISLQPNNNTNDMYFGIWNNANYGNNASQEFSAATWTKDNILVILRGAFKFDLSDIPVSSTILSAKLTLYSNPNPDNGDLINANSGANNSMYLQRISGNWTGATTWFNQPTVDATTQINIPHTNQSFLDLVDIDVTSMVNTMHNADNYGFMIRLQNEAIYNIRNFCSSRYPDAAKHPKLVVTYKLN